MGAAAKNSTAENDFLSKEHLKHLAIHKGVYSTASGTPNKIELLQSLLPAFAAQRAEAAAEAAAKPREDAADGSEGDEDDDSDDDDSDDDDSDDDGERCAQIIALPCLDGLLAAVH